MARLRIAAALLLTAVTPGLVHGQVVLTLDQAVSEALAGNRGLIVARSAATAAESGIREARAALLPRVTVAESWQRGNQPVFVFSSLLSSRRFASSNFAIEALNHPDPTGFFRTSVGVEQLIFDGGRQRAATRAASARHAMATHDAGQTAVELVLSVTETYGRLLVAQAARRAADAGVSSAREDLAIAERRRDAGITTEADVLGLRVHVADLEQRAIQAEADTAVARAQLNHLIGAAIDREYQAVEPALARLDALDRQALLAAAYAARPSLKRVEEATKAADATRRGAAAALVPQVAAQAGYEVSGTSLNDRASSWLVGGELRWTLSLGGAELARLRDATEAASRSRIERDDARALIEVEVGSAIRLLEAARARQTVGAAAVEQARESQRIIRDRFDAGIAGADEVLRASTALLDADARRTAALVDAIVGEAMLDRAIGRTR